MARPIKKCDWKEVYKDYKKLKAKKYPTTKQDIARKHNISITMVTHIVNQTELRESNHR